MLLFEQLYSTAIAGENRSVIDIDVFLRQVADQLIPVRDAVHFLLIFGKDFESRQVSDAPDRTACIFPSDYASGHRDDFPGGYVFHHDHDNRIPVMTKRDQGVRFPQELHAELAVEFPA